MHYLSIIDNNITVIVSKTYNILKEGELNVISLTTEKTEVIPDLFYKKVVIKNDFRCMGKVLCDEIEIYNSVPEYFKICARYMTLNFICKKFDWIRYIKVDHLTLQNCYITFCYKILPKVLTLKNCLITIKVKYFADNVSILTIDNCGIFMPESFANFTKVQKLILKNTKDIDTVKKLASIIKPNEILYDKFINIDDYVYTGKDTYKRLVNKRK